MAAPVVASVSRGTASFTGTINVTAPSGIQADDQLLAWHHQDWDTAGAMTAPSGWTQVGLADAGTNAAKVKLWRKTATGSEPGSYMFNGGSGSDHIIIIARITGCDPTTPLGTPATDTGDADTLVVVAPSATGVDQGLLLTSHAMTGGFGGMGTGRTFSTPTGMTVVNNGVSLDYIAAGVFGQELTADGATGTRSSTLSGGAPNPDWSIAALSIVALPTDGPPPVVLDPPVEVDTGLPVTASKLAATGDSGSVEAARSLTVGVGLTVGPARPVERGDPLGVSVGVSVGPAPVAESGRALQIARVTLLGPGREIDRGDALSITGEGQVIVGAAVEDDAGIPVLVAKVVHMGAARSVEAGRPVVATGGVVVDAGPAQSVEEGRSLIITGSVTVGPAVVIETGRALAITTSLLLGSSQSVETGRVVSFWSVVALGPATEIEHGLPLTVVAPVSLIVGPAVSTERGRALHITGVSPTDWSIMFGAPYLGIRLGAPHRSTEVGRPRI